jgi:hypothetical protein
MGVAPLVAQLYGEAFCADILVKQILHNLYPYQLPPRVLNGARK